MEKQELQELITGALAQISAETLPPAATENNIGTDNAALIHPAAGPLSPPMTLEGAISLCNNLQRSANAIGTFLAGVIFDENACSFCPSRMEQETIGMVGHCKEHNELSAGIEVPTEEHEGAASTSRVEARVEAPAVEELEKDDVPVGPLSNGTSNG